MSIARTDPRFESHHGAHSVGSVDGDTLSVLGGCEQRSQSTLPGLAIRLSAVFRVGQKSVETKTLRH